MHHFAYRDNHMFCEDVPVLEIAESVGTPFYLYSHATLRHHFLTFEKAFERVPHLICFSAKSNSNLAVLRLFASLGSGLDIVSGGELFRGLQAGIPPNRIVYSGVGKREDEIVYALQSGILMFNIESFQELELINRCSARLKKEAPISLRVNPDVDSKTHPYISTGLKENKFGLDMESAAEAYKSATAFSHVKVIGISCHIGSQVTEVAPFVDALHRIKALIATLETLGISISYLDLGGGLGITYDRESPPHPNEYSRAILGAIGDSPFTLILEPGRVIVGNAGILVTRVLYTKRSEAKDFVIVDAAMNDLVRPSLYNAYHAIERVVKDEKETIKADVVGPICESADFLARDRHIPRVEAGDLLAIMSAGAYGFTMSSNYNSRPRVPEVMVKQDQFYVVRARESYEDLIKGESIPPFL
ncbi:MAG: diaminopimelate decarboxylase [Deltaproteobacteria bacterium]|nr:diaminopimelate decarboxylase [Deltaproteobacteria bacterium]MBW2020430.1 diaminopimelate decarboxylase [Deltaproteobacteria bacterium]MBW2075174.1 diaminopimelate decarboxylase [Deltaproteobacteria bacterium]RLB81384.1 MAG: diaminopimelate decarboxylase [Deltaproteobacteria bacterium]